MLILYLRLAWHDNEAHSLKDKRQALERVLVYLRSHFNVSAVSGAHRDKWQRNEIEICGFVADGKEGERLATALLAASERLAACDVTVLERGFI